MSERSGRRFEAVVTAYRCLEPEGTDTWNPLLRDRELGYRLALYDHLCRALRRCPEGVADLRVLDVGCGNGRSTRMYLDFGLRPEQLTGIDLRPAAIAMARRCHGGIRYLVYDGEAIPVDSETVDWVSICTVLSSVGDHPARRHLAKEVCRVLAPDGFLFYFDRLHAHGFAGGDLLAPEEVFRELTVVRDERVSFYGESERLPPSRLLHRLLLPVLRKLIRPPTHRACLMQRRR